MPVLTYTGKLTVTACWCGIRQAIPDDLYRQAARHGTAVYCPLGHEWVFADTKDDQLKREAQQARDALAAERARADGAEASLRATKGHVTRLRNAALAGDCPLCGKHVYQLARHMRRAHKDEHPEPET